MNEDKLKEIVLKAFADYEEVTGYEVMAVARVVAETIKREDAEEARRRSADYRTMGQDAASNVMSNIASHFDKEADALHS